MLGMAVDNLSMNFTIPGAPPVQALKDVSLTIAPGEMMAIPGPSGCGKTTLLNILSGFLAPTSGRVLLGERAVTGPGPDRGMVFQQGALFEWMDVARNVSFGPRMKGLSRTETDARVAALLASVGHASGTDLKAYTKENFPSCPGLTEGNVMLRTHQTLAALFTTNIVEFIGIETLRWRLPCPRCC